MYMWMHVCSRHFLVKVRSWCMSLDFIGFFNAQQP